MEIVTISDLTKETQNGPQAMSWDFLHRDNSKIYQQLGVYK